MVMGDTPTPRPTYVLVRGQYTDHGEQVPVRGLDEVFSGTRRCRPTGSASRSGCSIRSIR